MKLEYFKHVNIFTELKQELSIYKLQSKYLIHIFLSNQTLSTVDNNIFT